MLKLPQVTLLAIDCYKPERTVEAMEWSSRFVEFGDAVLLTDLTKWPNIRPRGNGVRDLRLRLVHHVQTDKKVPFPRPDHYPVPIDYEHAAMREPINHFGTSHCLFMEWDSGVANPLAWDDRWLKYDYIGAPWPAHCEPGWPPCDGETNNVGNGGFSLRSRTYCHATKEILDKFGNDPIRKKELISSDMGPCLSFRPWMERQYTVKFAPWDVAMLFSCENNFYSGQFGWHGVWTAEMNNWGGRFKDMRPKSKT